MPAPRILAFARRGRVAAGEDEAQPLVADRPEVLRLVTGMEQGGLRVLVAPARSPSTARRRAVVTIQPAGLGGTPSRGQRRTASVNASCTASSATSMFACTPVERDAPHDGDRPHGGASCCRLRHSHEREPPTSTHRVRQPSRAACR